MEPHKNLVDQCVQGEGLVRINVEIKLEGDVHKINVLDILEPDASFEEATGKFNVIKYFKQGLILVVKIIQLSNSTFKFTFLHFQVKWTHLPFS